MAGRTSFANPKFMARFREIRWTCKTRPSETERLPRRLGQSGERRKRERGTRQRCREGWTRDSTRNFFVGSARIDPQSGRRSFVPAKTLCVFETDLLQQRAQTGIERQP